MRMLFIMLMLPLFLSGCSHSSYRVLSEQHALKIPINEALFDNSDIDITSEEEIFTLTAKQQAEFLSYLEKQIKQGKPRTQIISDYLEQNLTNFNYFGETLVAKDAMAKMQGNCMSLAILTTSLAKLAGVDFGYREVITLPVFEKQNSLILSSIHVQTKLFSDSGNDDAGTAYIASRSGIIIDYFPSKNNIKSRFLRYPSFVAMYYKNIASDALIAGDLAVAFAYANEAHKYDRESVEVTNLLAVIHRRAGDDKTAERIYKIAREVEKDNLSILNNYVALLNSQKRYQEASVLEEKMGELDDHNPYRWLELAYVAHDRGKLRAAEKYYQKTLELAPYVKQAYLGLYHVYIANNKTNLAKTTLKTALDWAYQQEDKMQLKYKLYGRGQQN